MYGGFGEEPQFLQRAALAKEIHSDIKVAGIELTGRTGGEESYNFLAELKTSEGDLQSLP